jgi:DNA replication and repair protein RecF
MRLASLALEQFRNYAAQSVSFTDEDIQLFVGNNGSGKTNLIEAISILSVTRSCRGREEQDMVMWEKPFYRLRAEVIGDNGERHRLEAVSEVQPRKRKAFFINDVRTQLAGIVGFLPTITFLPQDLMLFSGPPAERRRFLDQLLSQLSPEYLVTLSHYQKIIQQRNALLKRIAAGNDQAGSLDLWDAELAVKGSHITLARLELMETLNMSFSQELSNLGENWIDARLQYERKTVSRAREDLQEEMKQLLKDMRDRDIILQSTSVGPHREDWQVLREGRELPTFASRGQERVAVLALLLLEVSYLELRRGEKPVILLDDAFSELDDTHQSALLEGFRGHQVIMTATRVPPEAGKASVFPVEPGHVGESALLGE